MCVKALFVLKKMSADNVVMLQEAFKLDIFISFFPMPSLISSFIEYKRKEALNKTKVYMYLHFQFSEISFEV